MPGITLNSNPYLSPQRNMSSNAAAFLNLQRLAIGTVDRLSQASGETESCDRLRETINSLADTASRPNSSGIVPTICIFTDNLQRGEALKRRLETQMGANPIEVAPVDFGVASASSSASLRRLSDEVCLPLPTDIRLSIGRSQDCLLTVTNEASTVAPLHAELWSDTRGENGASRWWVCDRNTLHGTWVNGQLSSSATLLTDNAVIRLGKSDKTGVSFLFSRGKRQEPLGESPCDIAFIALDATLVSRAPEAIANTLSQYSRKRRALPSDDNGSDRIWLVIDTTRSSGETESLAFFRRLIQNDDELRSNLSLGEFPLMDSTRAEQMAEAEDFANQVKTVAGLENLSRLALRRRAAQLQEALDGARNLAEQTLARAEKRLESEAEMEKARKALSVWLDTGMKQLKEGEARMQEGTFDLLESALRPRPGSLLNVSEPLLLAGGTRKFRVLQARPTREQKRRQRRERRDAKEVTEQTSALLQEMYLAELEGMARLSWEQVTRAWESNLPEIKQSCRAMPDLPEWSGMKDAIQRIGLRPDGNLAKAHLPTPEVEKGGMAMIQSSVRTHIMSTVMVGVGLLRFVLPPLLQLMGFTANPSGTAPGSLSVQEVTQWVSLALVVFGALGLIWKATLRAIQRRRGLGDGEDWEIHTELARKVQEAHMPSVRKRILAITEEMAQQVRLVEGQVRIRLGSSPSVSSPRPASGSVDALRRSKNDLLSLYDRVSQLRASESR